MGLQRSAYIASVDGLLTGGLLHYQATTSSHSEHSVLRRAFRCRLDHADSVGAANGGSTTLVQ